MGIIKVTNIQVYAYHGCLVEEGKIGSDYRVDVAVKANLQPSAASDQLKDTVDYVQINRIVKEEMAIRSKLLEHVAKRILDRILAEIEITDEATVAVSKINPPIGGNVEQVTIEMTLSR
ncbi:dihydroneopterin aldolase [Joostella sp. CR20]|uniref:dihydroneopterin aldolase n=1 Tax=Joostella sp. CR20 TaxID=2804312 RepID=UPI00313ABF78